MSNNSRPDVFDDYDIPLAMDEAPQGLSPQLTRDIGPGAGGSFEITVDEASVFMDVPVGQIWAWIAEGFLASTVGRDGGTRVAMAEVLELTGLGSARQTG